MVRISLTQALLWCAAGVLMLIDFTSPTGDWGRLSILVGTAAIARAVIQVGREMRRAFECNIGRAYNLGRRAERREQAAVVDLAPIRRLRR